MRFISTLIGFEIVIAVFIFGIGTYLAPNGLSHCGTKPSMQGDCTQVDAIVAISGGDTTARTAHAINLYENGWAGLLVFSGAAQDKSGPSNAEAMKRQALAAGVPSDSILIDETSETTKENADNSINLFTENDIHSVILVTSAYHQRRAGLEFGQRAGSSIKIINNPVTTDNQWSVLWWTTPTGWYLAMSELVKIAAFYIGSNIK